MKPWSHKRRKWNHDVEAHRTYLLNMWFCKEVGIRLAMVLDNAILYGTGNVLYDREKDGTFSCTISMPDVLLRQITGVDYAKRSG